jgi:predicted RNA-binding Zn ribbon-like protein
VKNDLILDFVNTRELRPVVEDLDSPRALVAWLAEHGLLEAGTRASRAELAEAQTLREALRDLLAAHNGLDVDLDAATARIDEAACRARLALRFSECESRLEPGAGGVRGALGKILIEVTGAMADGTWERMKACRADDCLWAFLDTAKNQSRAWCSMRSCGNREKVRAYRERHASH